MTHLSFQLRQVRNLHELCAPVLVPYHLSLVTPEDNTDYSFHSRAYFRKELDMVLANLESVDINSSLE